MAVQTMGASGADTLLGGLFLDGNRLHFTPGYSCVKGPDRPDQAIGELVAGEVLHGLPGGVVFILGYALRIGCCHDSL